MTSLDEFEIKKQKRPGRPWVIDEKDVRLYYEAYVDVALAHEWPWSEAGKPNLRKVPDRDDELPSPENLKHQLQTYLNSEALKIVKARVRKARHRSGKKPVSLHVDEDAWAMLSSYARTAGVSLSEAIRMKFKS